MNLASVSRRLAFAAALASLLISLNLAQAGDLDKAIDTTSQLVVMITDQLGTEPAFGAGIVFGRDKDRLYIMTANHVVRRGAVEATNVRVAFKSRPDKPLSAKLLTQADRELDVAVVVLEGWAGQGVEGCKLPFDNLGDAGKLQRGKTVYAIGNPNGENWRMPTPDRVYNVGPDQLQFQSAFIAVGSSGGALLNDEADIVGMVRRDEPPSGSAIPLSVVLPLVSKWGYPVQLRPSEPHGRTPLHIAAAAGDIERIRAEVVVPCPDTNVGDVYGQTPLMTAVRSDQLEAVRLLIQGGANVGAKSTAIHHAAAQHNQAVATLLLKAGADVNARDHYGGTPLNWVRPEKSDTPGVAHAKAEFVQFLIDAGADVKLHYTPVGPYDDVLLNQAVEAGNREMVAILLRAHADVNVKGNHDARPLHNAIVQSVNIEIIKLLIQAGADFNVGEVFREALLRENAPLVVLMLNAGARLSDAGHYDVLQEAIRQGWADVLQWALAAGAGVNLMRDPQTSYDGPPKPDRKLSPLAIAIEVNKPEMVRLLIANKADVNLADSQRMTALHLAASNTGSAAIIKLLAGAGANVNATNEDQETPLHLAVRSKNEEAARALLQAGAATGAKNSGGQTPVTLAKGTPLEGLLSSHVGR